MPTPARFARATALRRPLGVLVLLAALLAVAWPAAAVDVKRVAVGDGVEAWLVEDHSNPIISLSFAFRNAGAVTDPAGKEGLANMVTALLDQGAGPLDAQAFQRRLEDLAIDLGFDASLDHVTGTLRTLTRNRDAAFELLGLALNAPRFDKEAVARVKGQIESSLRRQEEDPDTLASRKFWATLFPGQPYGRPVDGTPAGVRAVAATDLKGFVKERFARDALVVAVVGDITEADLKPLLARVFGALPAKATPVKVASETPKATGETLVVPMAVPQSAIVFGQPGLKRDDPRYYTLTVLNQLIGGGGLTSALYTQVREKRGLAYSIYTATVPLDHAALIIGRAGTANARAGETVRVTRDEWRRFSQGEGIAPEAVADVKTYLTGSFPLSFTSSTRIANMLVSVQLEHLGIDYLDRRNGLIEAVTVEDVRGLAKQILDPGRLTFVVVGEPQGLPSVAETKDRHESTPR